MKIIVTGGAGFIGSHLCARVLEQGHEVFCIDNFITGSKKNVLALMENKKFHLIGHDITMPFNYDFPVDRIYHLACPASPVDYKELPLQTLWVNAAGTKNMLDLAVKKDAGFLFTSSSEIYGDPTEHPQSESYYGNSNPIGARSCYCEGKRFSESLCMNYFRNFDATIKVARLFNVYGPGMRRNDGRAIPEFVGKALAGEPLTIFGDGLQTRSFCFVDDMISGLTGIMETGRDFPGPVNLGNPVETSILDLAKMIVKMSSSTSVISFFQKTEDDPVRRKPDISLAQNRFGFKPQTGLEEGLKKTIEYFRKNG